MRQTTAKRTVVSGVLFVLLFWLINGSLVGTSRLAEITGGPNILDFQFGYTPEVAWALLESLGEEGRAFYLSRIVPLDVLFPPAYAGFFALCTGLLLRKSNLGRFALLTAIPVFGLLSDYLENACIVAMLLRFPETAPMAARLGNVATVAKFTLCFASLAVIFVLAVLLAVRRLRRTCGF